MKVEFSLEILGLLDKKDLSEREKKNLLKLFEFTQYLLDDDNNLTKSLNLAKKAREQLEEQIQELFEGSLTREEENKDNLDDVDLDIKLNNGEG